MAKTKRVRNKRYSRRRNNTLNKKRRTRKTRCKRKRKTRQTRQRGGGGTQAELEAELSETKIDLAKHLEEAEGRATELQSLKELAKARKDLKDHEHQAEGRATKLHSLKEQREKLRSASASFIGSIYGQSTSGLPGYNKSLCDAMNKWLDDIGSEFTDHYIILCGPSDEKNEMKMGLSKGKIGDRSMETKYYDFEGYPICVYTYEEQNKTYNLIVLCEEGEFRVGSENNNFGGSVNTLENMFELFICYAFLKHQIPYLSGKTVDDIYHCSGSGMAQVMRACFNVVPIGYSDSGWVSKLDRKWQMLIDKCDGKGKTKLMAPKNTVIEDIMRAPNPMKYVATGKDKATGNMTNQFNSAIRAAKRDIDNLFGKSAASPGDAHANYKVLKPVKEEEFLEYGQKVHEYPNIIARQFLLENLFKNSGDMRGVSILNSLDFPEQIVLSYKMVSPPPRPKCHQATVEFFEWMENWSEWKDDKFISYLDGPGGDLLDKTTREFVKHLSSMELYTQKLNMDLITAANYGAGFNNGDLMKSIITYLFSPSTPLHYPQSIRTY